VSVALDSPDIPPCDCRPYPKPSPIDIKDIFPENAGAEGWRLDNQSYLNNAAFWTAVERYVDDVDSALGYWFKCVQACNVQYKKINSE
jgi:hypothetical protein